MTNYYDRTHHFQANLEETNEKAAAQLILKKFVRKFKAPV